jgi:hypothetical protein
MREVGECEESGACGESSEWGTQDLGERRGDAGNLEDAASRADVGRSWMS